MGKRIEVKILGRHLGTASGWDGDPGDSYWFYDFQSANGVNLQGDELYINETDGELGFEVSEDTGKIIDPIDICQFLVNIPKISK